MQVPETKWEYNRKVHKLEWSDEVRIISVLTVHLYSSGSTNFKRQVRISPMTDRHLGFRVSTNLNCQVHNRQQTDQQRAPLRSGGSTNLNGQVHISCLHTKRLVQLRNIEIHHELEVENLRQNHCFETRSKLNPYRYSATLWIRIRIPVKNGRQKLDRLIKIHYLSSEISSHAIICVGGSLKKYFSNTGS